MSYRHYPSYTSPPLTRTVSRETTTTTTERTYAPGKDYNYTYETTSSRLAPPRYSYRSPITTSTYGYSPKWYDTSVTKTTTNIGPHGVTSRTYRY